VRRPSRPAHPRAALADSRSRKHFARALPVHRRGRGRLCTCLLPSRGEIGEGNTTPCSPLPAPRSRSEPTTTAPPRSSRRCGCA
jgi:hypothetical protein